MIVTSSWNQVCRIGRVVCLTVLSLSVVAVVPAQAQRTDVDPLEDFQRQDGGSGIFDGNSQQGIQDILHQLNQLNDLSMEEFTIQRQDDILTEADRFRQLQRDRMNRMTLDSGDTEAGAEATIEMNLTPASTIDAVPEAEADLGTAPELDGEMDANPEADTSMETDVEVDAEMDAEVDAATPAEAES